MSKKPANMQQALHPWRHSAVGYRIPQPPFIERKPMSSQRGLDVMKHLFRKSSDHSDVVVSQAVDNFTFQRVCLDSPVDMTTTSHPLPR